MNCGTKARKKIATLGFSTLVQKPPQEDLAPANLRLLAAAGHIGVRRVIAMRRVDSSSLTPIHSR